MPFGLCNATATFQRLMAQALTRVTKKYGNLVMCYVDGYHMIIEHRMRHIHQNADSLSKKTEFYEQIGTDWNRSKPIRQK